MSNDGIVTEEQANLVAQSVAEQFGADDGTDRPQVYPGAHEGSAAPFVVSWEQGPFQWPYQQEVLFAVGQQTGVYLEAVNHFALAIYRNEPASRRIREGGNVMADQSCTARPAPARFESFRTAHVAYTRAEVIDLLAEAGIAARAALTGLPDEELLQVLVRAANDHVGAYAVHHTLANDSDDSHEIVETGQWSANLLADNEVAARR